MPKETATDVENSYSAAVSGAKDYKKKFMEFTQSNTEAAFAFAEKLWSVKSSADLVELSMEHSRQQIDTLTAQTKELATLAQKVTLAATEPLKMSIKKAFSRPA